MKKVLLVGNGFDLAHGLPTSYNDFLMVMKNWNVFLQVISNAIKGKIVDEGSCYFEFTLNANNLDENNLKKLGDIIQENSWVKYYCKCGAEIDKWIDFEREIYPVMALFEFVFNANYEMIGHGGEFGEAHIKKEDFSPKVLRTARLWEKYFDVTGGQSVCVKESFASMKYGILKKKILDDLKAEFNEFIEAFEIYLHEFVDKKADVQPLKQIKGIELASVISFNYTLTETLYGIKEENVHHIHGMIREDVEDGNNNMVMGVNEQEKHNMEFIYFVKYFQRIKKASGVKYKSFVDSFQVDSLGQHVKEKFELYIYGHSLDETDEDILKYVIGKRTTEGKLKLKPEKVIIYYYNPADYEQKVINLIKLYGRSIVEEYMEKELFKFEETRDEVWKSV